MLQQATHKADFQGILPTGNKISFYQIAIMQVNNGKGQGWWIDKDNLGMMMQLGMELRPREVKSNPYNTDATAAIHRSSDRSPA